MLFLINKGIFLVFDQLRLDFFKFHDLIQVLLIKVFSRYQTVDNFFLYFFFMLDTYKCLILYICFKLITIFI